MISFQVFYRIQTRLQPAVQHRGLELDLTHRYREAAWV